MTHVHHFQPQQMAVSSGDSHQVFSLLPQARGRQISTIDQWTSAFLVFGAIYAQRFPEAAPGLFKYCEVVRDIAATGPPLAWRQYDARFRSLWQFNLPDFPWEQPRWDLFFKCMYTKDVQGGQLVLPILCPPNSVPRSPFQLATAGNTSEGASVTRVCANSSTCVPNVMHPTHPAHVVKKSAVPTPLNPEQLLQALTGYDQAEINFLVDGFIKGFKINYFGTPSLLSTHNHPSALDHKDVVEQKLSKELSLGRISGPFISPPFTHYQSSTLGLVAKKEPNAFRLIHDLSYPQGNSKCLL